MSEQYETKAMKLLKSRIAELEAKCRKCSQKDCSKITCEVRRKIDNCNDLLSGRGRHSR